MRTPSHAGRHPPEGRTHPRRQVFSHNGVPDGKALYRQVAALKDGLSARVDAFVRVARDFSGADKVHAVGYCIGGTALAIYMAWAARHFGEEAVPVRDWTLLTTLVDFHTPGDIEVFIDEGSVAHLTAQMQRKGYLDGKDMASSFRLL